MIKKRYLKATLNAEEIEKKKAASDNDETAGNMQKFVPFGGAPVVIETFIQDEEPKPKPEPPRRDIEKLIGRLACKTNAYNNEKSIEL